LLSAAGGGLTPTDEEAPVWRVAIYAREGPGRAGRNRLNRQFAGLATQVVRQRGWRHVATYGDQDFGVGRPGLSRLLTEVPGRIDLVAVDGYGRLSSNRHEQNALLAQLGGAGVRVVALRPSTGRRPARMVANLALADVIASAAR
jgi:DNA invertase Pin-like site-specific DNA recombinase